MSPTGPVGTECAGYTGPKDLTSSLRLRHDGLGSFMNGSCASWDLRTSWLKGVRRTWQCACSGHRLLAQQCLNRSLSSPTSPCRPESPDRLTPSPAPPATGYQRRSDSRNDRGTRVVVYPGNTCRTPPSWVPPYPARRPRNKIK